MNLLVGNVKCFYKQNVCMINECYDDCVRKISGENYEK